MYANGLHYVAGCFGGAVTALLIAGYAVVGTFPDVDERPLLAGI